MRNFNHTLLLSTVSSPRFAIQILLSFLPDAMLPQRRYQTSKDSPQDQPGDCLERLSRARRSSSTLQPSFHQNCMSDQSTSWFDIGTQILICSLKPQSHGTRRAMALHTVTAHLCAQRLQSLTNHGCSTTSNGGSSSAHWPWTPCLQREESSSIAKLDAVDALNSAVQHARCATTLGEQPVGCVTASDNDLIFMYSRNLQHQIPKADQKAP